MRVRYYGPLGLGTGYARAGEGLCRSLLAAGVDLEIRPIGPPDKERLLDSRSPLIPLIRTEDDLQRPDVVIVHALPLDCRPVLRELAGTSEFADAMESKLIAYTTLEFADEMPPEMAAEMDGDFDSWWFPCAQNVDSAMPPLSGGISASCERVPHAFDDFAMACAKMSGDPVEKGRDEPFVFYYVGAWNNRKNPEGLIRAYTRAFTRRDPVRLILRCSGASLEQFVLATAATGVPQSELPVMMFRPEHIPDPELAELHRRADCFVTASRGEAWNYCAFDAVASGRHVITTSGLGSEEFLVGSSAVRVPSRSAPAGVDVTLTAPSSGAGAVPVRVFRTHGYSTKTLWREPDLVQLAAAMRRAYEHRTRDLVGGRLQVYSYEAVGDLARELIENT